MFISFESFNVNVELVPIDNESNFPKKRRTILSFIFVIYQTRYYIIHSPLRSFQYIKLLQHLYLTYNFYPHSFFAPFCMEKQEKSQVIFRGQILLSHVVGGM